MTRFTIGLLAAALLAASAPAADSPKEVVEKAMVAMALKEKGKVDDAKTALQKLSAGVSKLEGKMTIDGTDLPFTGSMTYAPGKVRMSLEVTAGGQKATLEQVVNDGKVKQTENGKAVEIKEPAKTELLQAALLQDVALLYPLVIEGTKYTLSPVTNTTFDAVKVEGNELKEVTLYFDKDTHLLAKMTRKGVSPSGKVVDEETVYDKYDKSSGLNVPMSSKVTHDGKLFLDIKVTKFDALEKTDEKFDTGS